MLPLVEEPRHRLSQLPLILVSKVMPLALIEFPNECGDLRQVTVLVRPINVLGKADHLFEIRCAVPSTEY
jgi:hypothetical protein